MTDTPPPADTLSIIGQVVFRLMNSTSRQFPTMSSSRSELSPHSSAPEAPFDGLHVLLPARDYKNRHASILLTLEATAEAMEQAEQANCA